MNPELYTGRHGTYFVHPQALARVSFAPADIARITPVLILPSPAKGKAFDRQHVLDTVERFSKSDDVFSADFLTSIMIMQDTVVASKRSLWNELETCLGRWDVTRSLCLCDGARVLPPGPYFLQAGCLHQAWRCYVDELDAFSVAVYPEDVLAERPSFKPLTFLEPQGVHRFVAVPSRLYHTPSIDKPLAGERITVKNDFSLSYIEAKPDGQTGSSVEHVQRLQALGAIVIGRTRTSACSDCGGPKDNWAEFQARPSPPADQLMTPPGSSEGMAMAVPEYKWLGHATVSDTS